MDDYSTIEFAEVRNAPNNSRVVVQRGLRGPQMISAGPGQRTFYPHLGIRPLAGFLTRSPAAAWGSVAARVSSVA